MTRTGYGFAAVMIILMTAGCDESLQEFAGPTPNLEPTFSSIQRDIFSATDAAGRVACTGCHTSVGRTPAAGLNLADANAYTAIVNRPSVGKPSAVLVIPGDPDNSYLVQKLEGAPGIVGQRMPRTGGPFLTPNQIFIIRRWIELGAPNN
jgi:hypothetical protein